MTPVDVILWVAAILAIAVAVVLVLVFGLVWTVQEILRFLDWIGWRQ